MLKFSQLRILRIPVIVLSSLYICERCCNNNNKSVFVEKWTYLYKKKNFLNKLIKPIHAEPTKKLKVYSVDNLPEMISSYQDSIVGIERALFVDFGLINSNAYGSGFIIDSTGLIVTSAHLVGKTNVVNVKLSDGTVLEGNVVRVDERLDLALIQVNCSKDFVPIPLSDRNIQTGDWVVALGSPLNLSNSATVGIVSKSNRDGSDFDKFNRNHYIQTDAAITVNIVHLVQAFSSFFTWTPS
ncbi:hypothetical protein A3Q56_06170 [Intoshia linei]|uniref:Uncharacterized protein n=1 Tax=Intoshia linei TaxID=1819745 RepID=A0A177AW77_9BILA|nr:hypothetical protein A3Q56_06170 [Intoshia linei]